MDIGEEQTNSTASKVFTLKHSHSGPSAAPVANPESPLPYMKLYTPPQGRQWKTGGEQILDVNKNPITSTIVPVANETRKERLL